MSADFWAGYVSGAVGILIGNPLDIIKTKLQAGPTVKVPAPHIPLQLSQAQQSLLSHNPASTKGWTHLARGAAAPILGYGALNAIMFMTYNCSLSYLHTGSTSTTLPSSDFTTTPPQWYKIWSSGALGGLATFFVSTPTELVKCRAQLSTSNQSSSSWQVTKELWNRAGLKGLYRGGSITVVRDSIGYGFYFWSYELGKRNLANDADSEMQEALKVLLCGGLAGVVTWASIFPLDVVKTRVQTWDVLKGTEEAAAAQPLLASSKAERPSTLTIARQVYQIEGAAAFFRGLGVCSARAFIVNAVQWAVYEWTMKTLTTR